jgi:hypothetical protein
VVVGMDVLFHGVLERKTRRIGGRFPNRPYTRAAAF